MSMLMRKLELMMTSAMASMNDDADDVDNGVGGEADIDMDDDSVDGDGMDDDVVHVDGDAEDVDDSVDTDDDGR